MFLYYILLFKEYIRLEDFTASNILWVEHILNNKLLSFLYSSSLSFKTYFMVFLFILVRASYPRLRFDKLMAYCWTDLLPIAIAIIIFSILV